MGDDLDPILPLDDDGEAGEPKIPGVDEEEEDDATDEEDAG